MGLRCRKDVCPQIMVNCIVCSFVLCISFVVFLFENVKIREVLSWVGFHDGCLQTMAWGPIGHYKCSSSSFSSILDSYWFRPIPSAENNMVSGLFQKWFRLQVTTSTSTYPRQTIWKWKCLERWNICNSPTTSFSVSSCPTFLPSCYSTKAVVT